MSSSRRITPAKSTLQPVPSEALSTFSMGDSVGSDHSISEEDEAAVVGDVSQKKLMCRINKLTVLVAMIMWLVSNTRRSNKQLQDCMAFIKMVKEKKPKDVTAMDRHCIRTCECKFRNNFFFCLKM